MGKKFAGPARGCSQPATYVEIRFCQSRSHSLRTGRYRDSGCRLRWCGVGGGLCQLPGCVSIRMSRHVLCHQNIAYDVPKTGQRGCCRHETGMLEIVGGNLRSRSGCGR